MKACYNTLNGQVPNAIQAVKVLDEASGDSPTVCVAKFWWLTSVKPAGFRVSLVRTQGCGANLSVN